MSWLVFEARQEVGASEWDGMAWWEHNYIMAQRRVQSVMEAWASHEPDDQRRMLRALVAEGQ